MISRLGRPAARTSLSACLARTRQHLDAIVIGVGTVTLALGFKHAYATAGADALGFILVPSCLLARDLGGVALTHEPGAGYIMHAPRMIVGPSCSGLTFLVVAWLAFYFHMQGNLGGVARKLAWVCASAVLAYLVTIATNATRIVLAAHLYDADIYAGVFTKARAHRVLGVVLYCTTLLTSCQLFDRWSQRGELRGLPVLRVSTTRVSGAMRLPPLTWYLAVVLLVPWLHYATGQAPAEFAEHVRVTLLTSVGVAGIAWLIGRAASTLSGRKRTPSRSGILSAP